MSLARKYIEPQHDRASSPSTGTVSDRAAKDWFVDPAHPLPGLVPDPLEMDPVELSPIQNGLDAGIGTVSPLALLFGTDDDGQLSWQDQALCAQTDPEAFFPEKGGSTREAKRVCGACEVRSECLEYALANDERFGIWGGLSERERRRLKKQAG